MRYVENGEATHEEENKNLISHFQAKLKKKMFLFITALIFMSISKLRFPKKVSIVTIIHLLILVDGY